VEELNIGHHLVSRAVFVGMKESVRQMLQAIEKGALDRTANQSSRT
jgi:pyridoxine 5'-phosphate synthase PdxJ